MPWVVRDSVTTNIVGVSAMQSSSFPESVLTTDPDYVAYLLVNQKTEKLKALKGKRDDVIGGCVEVSIASTAHKFQVDKDSYNLISNTIAVKERGNSTYFPLNWIDADNASVTVTDVELIGIHDLAGRLTQASYDNYQTHREAINDATDQTALDAVDITTGWKPVPYTGG